MVSIELQREVGSVEVTSQPIVDVKVNGQVAGKTPLTLKLPAVAQTIELSKPGYRTISKTVTPSAQKTVSVKVQLQTELTARLAAAPPQYTNSAGIRLKLFHPTDFNMGAPRSELGQRANEFQRTIKLTKPFYASLHEITKEQYARFKANGSSAGADNFPVTSVSWSDAAAYCNWLSAKEHLQPVYVLHSDILAGVNKSADGYRLLTEAEWEWLARRAGRKTQTIFPWGDKSVVPPMSGNISDESARGHADFYVPKYNDGHAEMAPVGSFPAEPSGLFDLAGNAGEWVHDYYSLEPPNAGEVDVDPLGPDYGDAHVVKGSSWRSGTRTELRGAYRDGLNGTRDDIGFRIGRYVYGGSK
ncbi:SUMF1/EgtB/PvdO family nonheme iron enzyme [Magnetovibrio blakemorei]